MLATLDPTLSYVDISLLQTALDSQLRPWRMGASLFTLFGVLALIVAAVGLYSVIAYLVVQRTHEIGVRIALGARSANILSLILGSSVGLAATGVGMGGAVWLAGARFVQPLLFHTSATNPAAIGGVALTLILVAVAAGLVPAIRARKIDPVQALRAD